MIGWPLLRLSQPAARLPMTQTILDVVVLLALLQVVIWPPHGGVAASEAETSPHAAGHQGVGAGYQRPRL